MEFHTKQLSLKIHCATLLQYATFSSKQNWEKMMWPGILIKHMLSFPLHINISYLRQTVVTILETAYILY